MLSFRENRKKLFFAPCEKGDFANTITRLRKVVETFPIVQNVRNSHIHIGATKQHIDLSACFSRKS